MSTPQPLTSQEQTQLEALLTRRSAAEAAAKEADRKIQLDKFKPIAAVIAAFDSSDVFGKLDKAITEGQDVTIVTGLTRLRQILLFEVGELRKAQEGLNVVPIPPILAGP